MFYVHESSLQASIGRRFGGGFTLKLDGGAILGGALDADAVRYDVKPGFVVSATVAKRWVGGSPGDFFLVSTLSVGVSSAETSGSDGSRTPITAQDNRLGIVAGKNVAGVFSPYIAARAFGGPVFFRENGQSTTGTDLYHYALGFGGDLTLGEWDLSYEGAFLGERSLSFAIGRTFADR